MGRHVGSSNKTKYFSPEELERIEIYLCAYINDGRSDSKTYVDTFTTQISQDITFPDFRNSDLNHIQLPHILTSKQRRQIHEMCTVIKGLYHGSMDAPIPSTVDYRTSSSTTRSGASANSERVFIIARDLTALEQVLGTKKGNNSSIILENERKRLLKECRPWYYRRHTSSSKIQIPTFKNNDSIISTMISYCCRFNPNLECVLNSTNVEFVWKEDVHVRRVTERMRCEVQLLARNPLKLQEDISPCKSYHDEFDLSSKDKLFPEYHRDLKTVPSIDSTPMVLIDTPQALKECQIELQLLYCSESIETLNHPKVLAFDLEMHNTSPFMCKTCLLQLATLHKDYVVDVLAPGVWDIVGDCIGPIFSDKSIVKVGHAIGGMDIPSLHRDFGIVVLNAFDTYEAAKVLKLPKFGLAAVCSYYGLTDCSSLEYSGLKVKYQKSFEDWITRPLLSDMLRYARYDVRYLIYLRSFFIRDMKAADELTHGSAHEAFIPTGNTMLSRVLSKSQRCCNQLWKHKDEKPFMFTSKSYSRRKMQTQKHVLRTLRQDHWSKKNTRILRRLLSWRHIVAWNEEIIPQSVCSMEYLTNMALICPTSDDDFYRINSNIPVLLNERKYKDDVLEIVRSTKSESKIPNVKKQWHTPIIFFAYVASSLLLSFASEQL